MSRRWVHEFVVRYDADGEAGLAPRSRRPHASPLRTAVAVEEAIVGWRKTLSAQGLDAGAETIAVHLAAQLGSAPSTATIWRILSRRGLVVAQPHKRPRSSYLRFVADLPNERWQADLTHWQLADGTGVQICDIIDDHSRYAIAAAARIGFKTADIVAAFLPAVDAHGCPACLLTDIQRRGLHRRTPPRPLRPGNRTGHPRHHPRARSRPYHPQTCGKVERFHQTLKRWLTRQDPAATVAHLQAQLDTLRGYYNQKRPHRALNRRTPATAYTARPKAVPTPPTPATPARHHRVRVDRIDTSGVVTLRHNSRLHHIGIGRAHAGKRITLLIADLHIRIITDDGELIRELTLDPNRDYQPQPR